MKTAEELIDKHIGIVSARMHIAIRAAMKSYAKEALEELIKKAKEDGYIVTVSEIEGIIKDLK